MAYQILSRTYSDVVGVPKALTHLRLWDESEAEYVQDLLDTAMTLSEKYMGRLITESTVIAELSTLQHQLPLGRTKSVTEISYIEDRTEDRVTLDPSMYSLNTVTNKIVLKRATAAFLAGQNARDYQVTFVTGWTREEVPKPVEQAILMLVGTMYEMREDAAVGQGITVTDVPVTHKYLLNPFKIYKV